jgi:hypothetical protein
MIGEEIFEIIQRLNPDEGVSSLLAEQNAHLVLHYGSSWRRFGERPSRNFRAGRRTCGARRRQRFLSRRRVLRLLSGTRDRNPMRVQKAMAHRQSQVQARAVPERLGRNALRGFAKTLDVLNMPIKALSS